MTAKKIHALVCLTAIAVFAVGCHGRLPAEKAERPVRNVIVMVPDGCDPDLQALARWVKGAPLNLDGLNSGAVATYMADSIITDSASAATAFATGHKTSDGFLSVGPRSDTLLTGLAPTAAPYAPVATVLEGARLSGLATGLVASSSVTHATPAAFASHVHDRGLSEEIMEQMVYAGIDVVLGGGAGDLLPEGRSRTSAAGDVWQGRRTDGEDLIGVLLGRGVRFVDGRQALAAAVEAPVWGVFDDGHLDPDIDRDDLHPSQPSLAEMTAAAIGLLSRKPGGFFLMVEGSQVDWAAHANDAAYLLSEFLAFDAAVGVAVDFAAKDGRTLVLIFPDHATGGLSIGHQMSGFPPGYTRTPVEALTAPVRDAKMTLQLVLQRIPLPADEDAVRRHLAAGLGPYWQEHLTGDHARFVAAALNDAGPRKGYSAIAEYLSRHLTLFGWTSHGHTGGDVPLWSYGPGRPVGTFDNTELAGIIAGALGFDLAEVSRRLFVDAADALPGAVLEEGPGGPALKIGGWRLPAAKDVAIGPDGRERRLSGVVVNAPAAARVFVPADAVKVVSPF